MTKTVGENKAGDKKKVLQSRQVDCDGGNSSVLEGLLLSRRKIKRSLSEFINITPEPADRTWLRAVKYYYENFQKIKDVVCRVLQSYILQPQSPFEKENCLMQQKKDKTNLKNNDVYAYGVNAMTLI